jgi:nicotinic acid mononucleotide adenylyltransferase
MSVKYVCGADLACKCGLFCGSNVDWCAGVIAVGRPGDSLGTPQLKKLMSRTPSRDLAKDFVLIDTDTEDISSTLVRQKLKAGEPIDDLVPPEVVQYIQNNDIKLIPPKSDWSVYQ